MVQNEELHIHLYSDDRTTVLVEKRFHHRQQLPHPLVYRCSVIWNVQKHHIIALYIQILWLYVLSNFHLDLKTATQCLSCWEARPAAHPVWWNQANGRAVGFQCNSNAVLIHLFCHQLHSPCPILHIYRVQVEGWPVIQRFWPAAGNTPNPCPH